ncbi:tetratricopeptide repeat protein [Lentzea sp. NPDC003310]|uniref:tetratricopeptide repeat protein n=1 Tax=Lentzea sp. NPDC003310 TaxID=3154447 RepID=UPI0033B176B6
MPHDDVSNKVDQASGQVVQAGTVNELHFHQSSAAQPGAVLPLRVGLVPQLAASFQTRATSDLVTSALDGGGTAVLTSDGAHAAVLSGMGGVGKTQIAAEFAERTWASGEIRLLVWITAGSREAIVAGYANASAKLTGREDPDPERGATTLLEWLAQTTEPWLVLLDDLQAPADLAGLWPPSTAHGRTVVTTRRRDAALRGHRRNMVEVGVFSEAEALTYLRTVLADHPLAADGAEDLVRDLGRLPLALAQAGAYIRDRHLSCAEYRKRLVDRRLATVLPDPAELPDEHRATVAATWSLSVEQANRLEPRGAARPLLDIASTLDANGIPIGVFTSPAVLVYLSHVTEREFTADDARDGLACLHRLNLLTLTTTSVSREVRVHALVQRATRDVWSDTQLRLITHLAAEALGEIWPARGANRLLGQVLRANVDAIMGIGAEHFWTPGCHVVLFLVGQSLGESGFATEARNYFKDLHEATARRLGPDDYYTLSTRYNLGIWLDATGDRAGAIAEYEQLLADRIRVFGPDHRDTLVTRSRLLGWRAESGDLPEAPSELDRLVKDFTRVLGADDSDTLVARNRLAASLVDDAGRALAAFESLLADRLRVLGADHYDTLVTRGHLAATRSRAGDPNRAVADLERLVADDIRVLGPDHPNTLMDRNNLAFHSHMAGDSEGALSLLEALQPDLMRVLGPDHPYTGLALSNLEYLRKQISDAGS